MISFALSVELQALVSGTGSLDKLSTSLGQIQDVADNINKSFSNMTRGLQMISSKLDPLVTKLAELNAQANLTNEFKMPNLASNINQVDGLARSYQHVASTLETIIGRTEKLGTMQSAMGGMGSASGSTIARRAGGPLEHDILTSINRSTGVSKEMKSAEESAEVIRRALGDASNGVKALREWNPNTAKSSRPKEEFLGGGFGKLFAIGEAVNYTWKAATGLQTEVTKMKMQGVSEQEIDRIHSNALQVAKEVPGATTSEIFQIQRKGEAIFGQENMTQPLLSKMTSDLKAMSYFTGETMEAIARSTFRAIDSNGQLLTNGKYDSSKIGAQTDLFTKMVIGLGGDASAQNLSHSMMMNQEWSAYAKTHQNEALGTVASAQLQFGDKSGSYLGATQRALFGGRIAMSSTGRSVMNTLGLLKSGEANVIPNAPIPGMKSSGGVTSLMGGTVNLDPSMGLFAAAQLISKRMDDHAMELFHKPKEKVTEEDKKKLLDTTLPTEIAKTLGFLISEKGRADQLREQENMARVDPEKANAKRLEDPNEALKDFGSALSSAVAEIIKLGGVIEILNATASGLKSTAEFFHNNKWAGNLVTEGLELGASWLALNKILKMTGLNPASKLAAGAGGAAASAIGAAEVAEGAAILPTGPLIKAAILATLVGFKAAYETGKETAGVAAMANSLGLKTSGMPGSVLETGNQILAYTDQEGSAVFTPDDVIQRYHERERILKGLTPFGPQNNPELGGLPPKIAVENTEAAAMAATAPPPIKLPPIAPFRPTEITHGTTTDTYVGVGTFPKPGMVGAPQLPAPPLITNVPMPPSTGSIPPPGLGGTITPPAIGSDGFTPPNLPEIAKPVEQDLHLRDIFANAIHINGKLLDAGTTPQSDPTTGGSIIPASFQKTAPSYDPSKPTIGFTGHHIGKITPSASSSTSTAPLISNLPTSPILPNIPKLPTPSQPTLMPPSMPKSPMPTTIPKLPMASSMPKLPMAPSTIEPPIPGMQPGGQTKAMGFNASQWDAYRVAVGNIENPRYDTMGGSGNRYAGKYQLGPNEIKETAAHLGMPAPSQQQFLQNPQMQEQFMAQYTLDHYNYLMKNPKFAALPKEQQAEILGYAHNQGAGGANKFINTGMVGHDAFGTAGTAYGNAIRQNWPTQTARDLAAPQANPDITNIPNQNQTHVHDIKMHLDGEMVGRHIFENQLDFNPSASQGITGFDWRMNAVAPGMSLRP